MYRKPDTTNVKQYRHDVKNFCHVPRGGAQADPGERSQAPARLSSIDDRSASTHSARWSVVGSGVEALKALDLVAEGGDLGESGNDFGVGSAWTATAWPC